jgi:acyl-CoA reductase-like NAD-dependent aldehyde dehydrogenase
MAAESRLFIDGERVPANSGGLYPDIDPATERVLGEVADADALDMDRAIGAARLRPHALVDQSRVAAEMSAPAEIGTAGDTG